VKTYWGVVGMYTLACMRVTRAARHIESIILGSGFDICMAPGGGFSIKSSSLPRSFGDVLHN
jgi:hypothetical protein